MAEHGRAERTLLAAAEDETLAAVRAELARQGVATALGASVGDVLGFVRAALGQGEPPEAPMALQIPPSFAGQPLVTPRADRLRARARRAGARVDGERRGRR